MAGPSEATMVAAQDASAGHGSLPGIALLAFGWARISTRFSAFNIYKLLTKIYKLKKFRCQGIRSGETLIPDTRDLRPKT
jgi:hypothetical protein